MAPSCILTVGILLVFSTVYVTSTVVQHDTRCLQDIPEVFPKKQFFLEGEPRPILLDGRPGVNPSADFNNYLVKILAEEVLGYQDVQILSSDSDFHNSTVALQRISGCEDASCRAWLMPKDVTNSSVNIEVWQDNLLEAALWLQTGTVAINGFLGYTARYGWHISQRLVVQMWDLYHIVADHWKSLHSPKMIKELSLPMTDLQRLVVVRPPLSKGVKSSKEGPRYYCEKDPCVNGMFIPTWCKGSTGNTTSSGCSALLVGYPDTSFSMLIGQIVSLNLPVIVAWIGPNLDNYVTARSQGNKPTLYFSWTPNTLTASGLYHRISFPTCVEGSISETSYGCDFQPYPVSKVSWLPLSHNAPDISMMITELSFSDFEMLMILGTFYRSDGNMANFACDWLKANKVVWSTWVPDKLHPKKKIYLGGLFPDNIEEYSSIGIGAQLAVEAVNKDGNILSSHEIELVVDGSDGSDAVASYLRLQNDKAKPIIGMIGPMESDDSKVVGLIAGLYKTVVISYSAESPILSNDVQFPYFARTMPSADEDAYAMIKFFKNYDWKRYAALSDSTLSSLEVISAVEDILESHEIALVSSQSFTTPLPLNPALFFDDIKNQRASIIIGKFSDTAARVLLCEAYHQDVTGYTGYQWFLPTHYPDGWWDTDYYNSDLYELPESVPCRTHEMALAVAGYMSLSRLSVAEGGERVIGGLSAAQWHERYQRELNHQGKQATDFAAYAYDAVWTFALAYEKLLQESPGALTVSRQNREMKFIMENLSETEFQGMTGKVAFDGTDRRGPVRIFQHVPQGSKVIMSVAQYVPHRINSSVWTGTFELNASDIVWLNDGKIPHDGTMPDDGGCAVESFRAFLNVDCQSAMAILNAFLIIVVFIILIIFVVLVKKAYDRKIKKAEERVKDLGIIALGQSTLLSLDKWEIPRNNVILNRKLGEGAFGTVYGGEALLTGTKWVGVAVKTLKVESTIEEKLDFLSEAEMMKRFDHKNIVQLLGVCTRREPIYAIMDFMLHGDLKTFLLARRHLVNQSSSNDLTVSPERLTSMVLDVATGLRYLASNKYVHRDLACRNCLVDCSYTVKIADFGMTRATYDSNYYRLSREGKMPVRWMAPESVNEGIFTTKSDVWSLGIIIYEVVTFGGFPYKDLSNADVLEFIRNNNAMRPPEDCSPSLAGLMQRCWSIEPEERPTASDVVEILSVNLDLIQPSINEPVMNILENDLAHSRTGPRGSRAASFQSESTIMDFDPPNISRTEQVASLGRRLRASFVRTLSWNRRRSHTLHTIEMSNAGNKRKQDLGLESSTQELVPSTFSVLTCTTRSSLMSLNQSMRTSLRSTSAPRDSSSSSGVDFNITDSVSGEMPIGGQFVLRRSATDSDIIDPTINNNSKRAAARQNKYPDLNLQPGIVIQIGDESLLLPTQQKSRQPKRSRSRSLGNIRSPHTPQKLLNERCINSEESKA